MAERFNVGDRVMWKADMEEYGVVVKNYATACDVKVWNSETGEYEIHHVMRYKLSHDG